MTPPLSLHCMAATVIPACPSAQRWCADCHVAVWVSHDMLARVDSGEVVAFCLTCGAARVAGSDAVARVHPDQIPLLKQFGIYEEVVALYELHRADRMWHP